MNSLAHSEPPLSDFIELYNRSSQPLDLSGCSLSDDPETNKFVFPASSIIPAAGFLSLDENQLGFSLKASGETFYLRNPDGSRILDAIRYEDQQNGISFGRVPDGAETFDALETRTPGASNSVRRKSDIVINEIMYAPISLNDDDQYVELYNRGTSAVNLGGWKFISGINYTFPFQYVHSTRWLHCRCPKRSALCSRIYYPNLNSANLVGNFQRFACGQGGERLALAMLDSLISTNAQNQLVTTAIYPVINEVTYANGGRWGQWSDGGGSSLELIDPRSDNSFAASWADSDETHKAPWSLISARGTIDNGDVTADQLQILLQGAGECLVDDVQVTDSTGNKRIANSSFESGANGWTAEGTESQSGLETSEGYNSSRSYHIRAVERGDNQVNRVRTPLTSSLASGALNVTIQARARWLKGHPELLLRLRGNWLECAGDLALPTNAGTPGARNSRFQMNGAPAIAEVKHSPVLPQEGEPVVVTARVNDPDGLSLVKVNYRLDPATTYSAVSMKDDGAGADEVAGDGIFTAIIPAQPAGAMIAFYVQANDASQTPISAVFPNDAPVRECLVRVGELQPTGNFPVYRIWMTQATLNNWNSRSKLNNTPLDVTFVLGNERVIYNTRALYAGSPYIAPGYCGPDCGRCGYSITVPADDLFLGEQDLVLDWPGGHGGETSAMQEQMGYWIADRMNLPFSHRYIVRLHVNGVTDDARQAVFEAVMQPAGGYLKEWSHGASSGEFFKIDRAFEFSDGGGIIADPEPRLENYTTTGGVKKRERYRWNWNHRSTDRVNNYTNIFALVDAVNGGAPEPYTSATDALVDMEEWMGIFATEHIIVNFDAYGHQIGKNMYAFLPDGGKWQLYMFDLDWLMIAASGYSGSYAPGSAPLFNADDPTITRMFSHPPFARAYWRAIRDAVNGPLNATNCNPVMDAKYQSLIANGVAWCDGQALTDPTAVKTWFSQRRTFLQSQLASVAASFTVNPSVLVSNGVAYVKGSAPVEVQTIQINDGKTSVTWTNVTGWIASVMLKDGTNILQIVGLDVNGLAIPGAIGSVKVVYQGTVAPQPKVLINEWMASNTRTILDPVGGAAEDWFELYNDDTNAVNLAGYYLSDEATNHFKFLFPSGYSIAPKQFLLVWADNHSSSGTPDLHVNFKLSKSGGEIGLYDSQGTTIDFISFGAQLSDVSEGRYPDGTAEVYAMPAPTPGTQNSDVNEAPPAVIIGSSDAGQFSLTWQTILGRKYQIESTNDLLSGEWSPEGDILVGTGKSLTFAHDFEGLQRFFRLKLLP